MKEKISEIILAADSHIASESDAGNFFAFLAQISKLPDDRAVVFMGDIFELWIAMDKYETDLHRRFCKWCELEKSKRFIAFIEGNHEFFPAITRKKYFSEVSDTFIRIGSSKFIHGDLINRRDWKYILLRYAIRNPLTRTLMRLSASCIGPRTAEKIRTGLKNKNMRYKTAFPEDEALKFINKEKENGENRIFAGHFHQKHVIQSGKMTFNVLPDAGPELVCGLYNIHNDVLEIAQWNKLSVFKN